MLCLSRDVRVSLLHMRTWFCTQAYVLPAGRINTAKKERMMLDTASRKVKYHLFFQAIQENSPQIHVARDYWSKLTIPNLLTTSTLFNITVYLLSVHLIPPPSWSSGA